MPSNLTWWQARDYAMAGTAVRRAIWSDPVIWITHTPGLFYYHEEANLALPSPAAADPVPHIVRDTEFAALEFLTPDWTTLPPGGSEPVLPPGAPDPPPPSSPPDQPPGVPGTPPGGYPPTRPKPPVSTGGGSSGSGGSGGGGDEPGGSGFPGFPTSGGGNNGGGIIVVIPPSLPPGGTSPRPPHRKPKPAPPFTRPTWSGLSAGFASGPSLRCSGTLIGGSSGATWECIARVTKRGITINLGTSDGVMGFPVLSGIDPAVTRAQSGDIVEFIATCRAGPQLAKGIIVQSSATIP